MSQTKQPNQPKQPKQQKQGSQPKDIKHPSQTKDLKHLDQHEQLRQDESILEKHNAVEGQTEVHGAETNNPSSLRILVAFLLNLAFSIFEFFGGIWTNSIAIASDAIHDFGDAISIGIAYFLERYSQKKPDDKYTYGYIRYSVLGSLLTTFILIGGSIIVLYNSVLRLINPTPVNYDSMILLAIFGVIVNFIAAYYTHGGKSLNQKSVNLHMLEDVLGWVVVLIGAIIMRFTDISILDPLLSIAVAMFILFSALKNLREVVDLFLERTPRKISVEQIRRQLLSLAHVQAVHHIHIWSMDGYHNYATLHIVCDHPTTELKTAVRTELAKFNISHVTIEFETRSEHCDSEDCQIEPNVSHHAHHH